MTTSSPTTHQKNFISRVRNVLAADKPKTRSAATEALHSNPMMGIMLNACLRHSRGQALTDLEQKFIDGFRRIGYTDEDFRELGEALNAVPDATRMALLPPKLAQARGEAGYSIEDLRADAPARGRSWLTTGQVRIVDTTQPTPPTSVNGMFPSRNVAQDEVPWRITCYGIPSGMLPLKPDAEPIASALGRAGSARYGFGVKLWADFIKVYDKSSEWSASDEFYFGFAVSDGTYGSTYRSEVIPVRHEDEIYKFAPNTLWDRVFEGGLIVTIDCLEQDNASLYEKEVEVLKEVLKQLLDMIFPTDWTDMASIIIDEITGAGMPAWVLAVAADIIGIIIIAFSNEDDYIGTFSAVLPFVPLAILCYGGQSGNEPPRVSDPISVSIYNHDVDLILAMRALG